MTAFSYSGRVKSPECRRQLRRADLRQFYIFRHRPIIIYTRLPSGGTYYPICMFPTNSERLIGVSDAFSAFVYVYPSSCPRAHCTPNKSVPTLRYTRRPGPVGTYRVQSPGFPKIVYWGWECGGVGGMEGGDRRKRGGDCVYRAHVWKVVRLKKLGCLLLQCFTHVP